MTDVDYESPFLVTLPMMLVSLAGVMKLSTPAGIPPRRAS